MKKIKNSIALFIVVVLLVYFYKVTLAILAIIVLIIILVSISAMMSDYKLKRFRSKNSGKYYLWYSSNKRLKEVIENKLKPLIDEKYELIYNNKTQIQSELSDEELRYLRNESSSIKFPIIFKIGSDKIHAESFFNKVYEYKHERINNEEFGKKIILKLNKLKNEQTKHKRRRS